MATKIVTKNSSTSGSAPSASDLVQGELAVNVVDKRLYTEDNAGNIVELGTNPLGEITANGGIALGDNDKATFGDGDDLEIYHDGSDSYITDVGIGDLYIKGGNDLRLQTPDGEAGLTVNQNGSVQVYHDNAEKLSTTATGIDVTGTATMDGLVVAGNISSTQGGSEGAPKFTLSGSTTTGLYTPAADTLGVSIAGTERMRVLSTGIDVTGNVDINGGYLDIGPSSGNIGKVGFDSNNVYIGSSSGTGQIIFKNNISSTGAPHSSGDTKMVITDSGVGIGTSLPTSAYAQPSLHIHATGNGAELHLTDGSTGTTATDGMSIFQYGLDSYIVNREAGDIRSYTNGEERMRIDSSGNVLVGTTDTLPGIGDTNAGISMSATNGIIISRANDAPINISRNSSDGALTYFRKDGAIVGSIGTKDGDLVIHSAAAGHEGLRLGNGAIVPTDNAGATTDAACNLGGATTRFTDLYLSGGVVFGTTGGSVSSKTLDDYEEGTWTPSLVGSTTAGTATFVSGPTGTYTKIGNKVTIYFAWNISAHTGAGALRVNGLPFALGAGVGVGAVMDGNYSYTSGRTRLVPYVVSSSILRFYGVGDGVGYLENTLDVSHQINGSVTYTA